MFPWLSPDEPMRFDRFMAAALHDPEQGYYARRIRGLGKQGDFTTAPGLSPALGKAVAGWAAEALSSTGCRDLIELGPGEGVLAQSVLRNLPWRHRLRIRLHLVESSPVLRQHQRRLLGRRIIHHSDVQSALADCRGKACLYSNEFVDAFPVRRFRKSGDGWQEHFVSPSDERWKDTTDLPESTQFGHDWPDQQQIEVHHSYHDWLTGFLPHWQKGRMLTIDYGARSGDLYHRQPRGSLRAFFHHQVFRGSEAWQRPGHQDITADVSFSDLIAWCGDATTTVALSPLLEFLRSHIGPSATDQQLLDPSGAGGAFLCLDQERG